MENKLWIFAFQKPLEEQKIRDLKHNLGAFLAEWRAHNVLLKASYGLYYNQFLKIEVDQSVEKASGCSIDSMKKFFNEWLEQNDLTLASPWTVFYLDRTNQVKHCLTQDLKQKLEQGKLTHQTTVLVNNLITADDFENQWKIPLISSPYQQFL